MNKTTYITTTIPYVNAKPHIGFALELVQADVLARYARRLGHRVRLQTGTDENAFKNVLSAREAGIDTAEHVERNARAFRELVTALHVTADDFVRTTEARHRQGVYELWRRWRPEDVYRARYGGLYCVGCEDFLLERELVDGRCPEHDTSPVVVEEENLFFRLSAYQNQILELLRSGRLRVRPESRRNEILRFVERGLQDISISRWSARSGGWGIPVPDDPSQVIYVWIDALVNYLSGPGFGKGDDGGTWWNEDVLKLHVIGKNVWKFHAVYWPALLLSAGLPLPNEIFVHGFLTQDGKKISKSLGNAVDPLPYITTYGADAVRYYLLRAVPPCEDGDFSGEKLRRLYCADLANGLGNLGTRLTALADRAGLVLEVGAPPPAPAGYHEALAERRFDVALAALWSEIDRVNAEVERRQPWKLFKAGESGRLREDLSRWLISLRRIAWWLEPFLPTVSERILSATQGRISHLPPLFPKEK